jgi:dodecin
LRTKRAYHWENAMSVARITEIIAGSPKSFQDAIEQGIIRANKTLKNIEGAWVKDQSIILDNGKIKEYRVALKVTFILKD